MTGDEIRMTIQKLLTFYDVTDAMIWMASEHPQLDDRKPQDCAFDEVNAVIERMESGAFL